MADLYSRINIEATGKKQLIIAGVVTDVCVTFQALSAVNAGYV
jgi:nicotinamidase-related amidase